MLSFTHIIERSPVLFRWVGTRHSALAG